MPGMGDITVQEDHPRSRGVYSRVRLMICWLIRDHPRSRGVYDGLCVFYFDQEGSSPLARGLRRLGLGRRLERRIIPARAGSTCRCTRKPQMLKDHPRSRGVYVVPVRRWVRAAGSSPLARGLPRTSRLRRRNRRIIPARAGSTLGDPWNPNDHSPYQTASAFTADLAPARRRCGSAAVERRSTMTPSEA